jgi:hypothetical protein
MTTSRQTDEVSSSVNAYLKVSECVMQTFRKNKSKMKNLTEGELSDVLQRGLALVDQPLQDIGFDPAELDYDPDADFYPVPSKPCKPSEATSVLTPSKVSSSGSVSITIRVPTPVVNGFKAMALEKCVGHQTLMNRQLRSVLKGS